VLIFLRPGATVVERERLQAFLRGEGFRVEVRSEGGTPFLELPVSAEPLRERLATFPGVEKVSTEMAPYLLAAGRVREGESARSVGTGDWSIGGGAFAIIAGPCAVESRAVLLEIADAVRDAGATMLRGGAFKPRTSPYTFRGLGAEGLAALREAGDRTGLPVVTEVLDPRDIELVARHADVLQVGSRNMDNFALLAELGRLRQPVLLKRGMSATLSEFLAAAEYVLAGGNDQVILCERGIRSFGTETRNTLDLAAVPALRTMTDLPVLVDPSHATGRADLVAPLCLAAAAVGADGIMVEVHVRPDEALCDARQAILPGELARLRTDIEALRNALAGRLPSRVEAGR
jgi:3-deoxy-7-phosphoheptulonate synthase